MARKQTKHPNAPRFDTIVGVAWYRPDQWQRLLEVAVDRDLLHDTYAEWVAEATARFQELQRMGIPVRKVEVDVEELVQWCDEQQQKVNGEARSMFAAEKTRRLSQSKRTKS